MTSSSTFSLPREDCEGNKGVGSLRADKGGGLWPSPDSTIFPKVGGSSSASRREREESAPHPGHPQEGFFFPAYTSFICAVMVSFSSCERSLIRM